MWHCHPNPDWGACRSNGSGRTLCRNRAEIIALSAARARKTSRSLPRGGRNNFKSFAIEIVDCGCHVRGRTIEVRTACFRASASPSSARECSRRQKSARFCNCQLTQARRPIWYRGRYFSAAPVRLGRWCRPLSSGLLSMQFGFALAWLATDRARPNPKTVRMPSPAMAMTLFRSGTSFAPFRTAQGPLPPPMAVS